MESQGDGTASNLDGIVRDLGVLLDQAKLSAFGCRRFMTNLTSIHLTGKAGLKASVGR